MKLTPKEVSKLSEERDIASLDRLKATGLGITACIGLDVCLSLWRLDLSDNDIRELDGVAALSALKWLSISKNRVENMEPIAELQSLEVLNVSHNRLDQAGLAPASKWSKLKALIANNNKISVVPNLSRLKDLDTLVLSHNEIRSIDCLATKKCMLQRLRKLSLSHNPLSDVGESLKHCPMLQELRLNHCQLEFLPKCLKFCAKLKILEAGGNPIKTIPDIAVIADMPSLQQLSLKGCPVASLPEYQTEILALCGSRLATLDNKKIARCVDACGDKEDYNVGEDVARSLAYQDPQIYLKEEELGTAMRRKEGSMFAVKKSVKGMAPQSKLPTDQASARVLNIDNTSADSPKEGKETDDEGDMNVEDLTRPIGHKQSNKDVRNSRRTGVVKIHYIQNVTTKEDGDGGSRAKRKKRRRDTGGDGMADGNIALRGIEASKLLRGLGGAGKDGVGSNKVPTWSE